MNSLIVYRQTGLTFNADEVWQKLQGIPGIYQLERGHFVGAVLQCEYAFKGDRTIARLSDDCASITISGTGDASLQLAIELQRRESQPLFVTDFGYDFNFSLKEIHTIEEFNRNILASADVAVA